MHRGKRGIKRSTAVDAEEIPIGGITAPANRHDSPLLVPTLEHAGALVGALPEGAIVHLDRGYDSKASRERLEERRLLGEISQKGKPSPLGATKRWVVERTSSWHNAHKKLVWCTERRGRVIDSWVAFSEVIIIVRRLIREGWSRYRWRGRPSRRPWPIRASTKSRDTPAWVLLDPRTIMGAEIGGPTAREIGID